MQFVKSFSSQGGNMTTLAELVVTWIYIWITTDSDITPDGYIERPGFLNATVSASITWTM